MKLQQQEGKHEVVPMTRLRIFKNVVVLSSGVMILFIAYDGLTMLQSTMNGHHGLGVASQAVLYFCFAISALIFPKYVIKRLGSKMTLLLSMASYIPYVASNFYPEWSVMIPTSVLLGFGAALLWGSQANYLNDVSVMYAELLLSEEREGETENGSNLENELEKYSETEREKKSKAETQTLEETQSRKYTETESSIENKIVCKLSGEFENESATKRKQRKTSNAGCRCISCVYVEYESTDAYLIENNLEDENGRKVKSHQESVSNHFNASAIGQPLSSSECHRSAKKPLVEHSIIGDLKQNCVNEIDFANQNSKLKDLKIVLNTVNVECLSTDSYERRNQKNSFSEISKPLNVELSDPSLNPDVDLNIANSNEKESNTKTGNQEICDSEVDVESGFVSNTDNPTQEDAKESIAYKQDNCNSEDCITTNQNLSPKAETTIEEIKARENNKSYQNRSPELSNSSEGKRLSSIKRKRVIDSTTARFFGFHGLFFLSSTVWSNLMSYFVLHHGQSQTSSYDLANVSCGVNFCGFQTQEQAERQQPSDATRYALTGVCVVLGVASVAMVATFLDALDDKNKDEKFSLGLLTATMTLAKRGKLLMLLPVSFHLGMSKGFYTADFTKAFVGCAWGTTHVGLVTVCYGAACALSSITAGLLVRRAGRAPIFGFGAAANFCACVLLLMWTPRAEEPLMLFVMAGLWGCHAGTVWSQIRAFYGILYKSDEEAAFATFHTWYSLGFTLSFAYSEFLCTYVKVYVLLAISTVGYIGYFIVERKHSQNINKKC